MKYAFEISDEDKADFLDLLAQGMKPPQAAKEIDSTGTQFKRFRQPKSIYYDRKFAAAWEKIVNSPEHRRGLEERVRDMVWESAEEGNISMRWKLALTYLPEFEWAKHQNLNVNMQMQVLTRALPALTMDELERVAAALDEGQTPLKALPPAADAA